MVEQIVPEVKLDDLKSKLISLLKQRRIIGEEDNVNSMLALEDYEVASFLGITNGTMYGWKQHNLFRTVPADPDGKLLFRLIDILRAVFILKKYKEILNGRDHLSAFDYKNLSRTLAIGMNHQRSMLCILQMLEELEQGWQDTIDEAEVDLPEGYVYININGERKMIRKPPTEFEF